VLAIGVIASRLSRLQHVSSPAGRFRMIEEPDRAFDRRGTEVHVPLRRGQILMPREFLNRSRRRAAHREMRAERMPQPMYPARGELRTPGRSFYVMLDHVCAER